MTAVPKTRRVDAVTPKPNTLRGTRVHSRPAAVNRTTHVLPVDSRFRFSGNGRSADGRSSRTSSASTPKVRTAPAVRAAVRSFRLSRLLHGDSLVIGTFLACFAVICMLGIAYLGVFANVQYLAVELHAKQAKLATATARQHDLMDQIGRLSSPDLIAAKAPSMNMELPTAHAFVDVPASGPTGPAHSTVMVAAN